MQNDEYREDEHEEIVEANESSEEGLEQLEEEETQNEEEETQDFNWEAEAKKWRAIAQRNKRKTSEKVEVQNKVEPKPITRDDTFKEEVKLLAKGYSDEEIAYLKVIARGAETTLEEAENNDLFKAYKDKIEADKKAQKAKLGASRGSAQKQNIDISKMTEEEHAELWKQRIEKFL